MPTFTYNNVVPNAPNNPSNDQPLMLQNTQSINSIINVDHYSFGTGLDGYHKQITLVSEINPGAVIGAGIIFSYSGGASLAFTATGQPSYNALFDRQPSVGTIGYTVLPGDIASGKCVIMQWGSIVPLNLPGLTPVKYALTFPSGNAAFSIQVTAVTNTNGSGDQTASVSTSSNTSSGFLINTTSSGTVTKFLWVAIGN